MALGWVRRSVSGLVSASLALGMFAACSSASDVGRSSEERVAGVYGAVIVAIADGQPGAKQTPVVFVAPQPEGKPIALTVQAAVVDRLAGRVSVRFVDDDNEAIDSATAGRPVKEGVLVRLGLVAVGDPVAMTVERYRSTTDEHVLTLSVRSNGDSWSARIIADVPAS